MDRGQPQIRRGTSFPLRHHHGKELGNWGKGEGGEERYGYRGNLYFRLTEDTQQGL